MEEKKVFEFFPYRVTGAMDTTEARRALAESLSGVTKWQDQGFQRSIKMQNGRLVKVEIVGELANQRAFIEIEKRDGTTAKIPRFMIR